ncbi:Uncharacterized protein PCOAH_00006870 [Plasmodium coatneyi]|uniref:HMG box domain-containing protein n=1 Tax=Plasmodium coatneyi TaxID=208452 RepID=A0A1B1DUZ7_9APIC|nr:Uncharacterized protein PCOAH_00006870 [Plasmodium coatneyi]ANQ06582.1 Uncharacterized protein PCOAH_00006870 [Plasmodium coatneyi]
MDYSKMPPMMNVPHGSGIYSNMAHTRGGMYTSVPPQSGAYPNMPPANSPYTNVPPANGPYANSITPAGLHSNVPHPKGGFSNVTHPSGGYTHIPNQSSAHANPQTASGTYVNVNSHPNGANGFHANNFQGAQGENYAPSYAANYAAGYTPNQGANCAPNLGPNYEGIYPQAGNNNYGKGCSNGHPSDHSNSHSNDNSNEYGSECANDYMNDYMHDYMNEYLNDYGMDDPTSGNHLDDTKEEKKKTIRGITSFTLFAREKRKELLNQKVFLGSSLTEQTTAVAKIWNSLSDEKKKEWAAKASKINEENYLSQKKKKKRKFTAFSIFAREKRKEHKEKNIDMGLTLAQQNSYVSKLWKQLSNEEKNKYKVLSNNVNAEVAKTNKNDMNYMSGEKLSGFKGRIKALDNMMNQQFSGNALPYHSGVNNMGYVNGMGYMHGVGTGRAPIGVVPPGQMNAASPQNGLSSTPNQGNPPSGINLPSGSIAPNESNDVNNLGYMDYVNYMNTVLSHDNPNYMNKIMSGGNENYMSMMNRLTNEMANGMTQEFTGTSPNGPPTGDPVKEKKNAKMKKKNKKEHMYITEQGQLMQKNDSYKMGKDGLPHETNNNMIGAFPSEAHTGVNPYNGNMPNVTNMAHVTNSGSYSQNNVPVNGPTPNNGNASVDMVHANNLLNYYSNQENPNVNQNSVNNVGSLTSPPNGKVHPPISMNGSGNPATAAMTNPPTGVDKKQPMINEQPNSNMGVMTDPSMFNNPNNNTANMISNVPYGGMPMGNPLPGNNNALNGVPFNNVPFNAVPPMYNIPPSGAPQGGTASGLPGGNFNPAGGMDMGRGPNGMNKQPFSNPYMSNVAGVHMHNVGENHLSLIPDHLIAGRKTKSKDKMEEMMRKKMKKDEKQKLKEKKLMMKMYDKKRKQLLKAEKQMEKNKKNKNKNGVNAFEDGSGGMYYNHPYPPNLIGTNINGIPFGAPNALMNKPMGGNFNPYVSMNQVDTKNMNIKNVTMASMMREGNPANHGVDNRAIPPNFQPANHMNNALSSTMRNNQPTPYPFSNNYPSDIPNMGNYTPGNQMKGYDDASRGVQDKQVAAIPTQPPNEVTTYQNVTLNEESKEKNVNPMDANLVVDSAGGNVTDAKSIPLMNEKEYRENYYKDVGGTDFAAYQQADSNKGAEVDKVADHMDKQANQEKSFCEPNGMNPMVGNVPTGHDSANASFDKQFLANENNPVEHKAETYYNQNENSKSKENATLYGEESLSVNYNHFNSSTPVTAQQQATFNKTLNEDVNVDLNYGNGSFVQTDACNGDNQNNTTGYFYPQGSAISGDKEESEKVNNPGAYGNQEMDGVVDANNVMYCPEQMLPENGVNKNLVYFDTDPNELPEMTDDTEMEAPKEKQFFSSASHYSELINKKVKKKKTLCSPNDANDNGGTIWDLVQKKGRKKIKVNSANQVEGESENVPMEDGTMYTNKNDFSFMETNNEWNSGRVGVNVECTSKEEEADDIVNSIFRSLEMEENVSPPEGGAAVSQNGDNVVAGEDTLLNPANQNHAEDATNWENETSLEQNNEDDIINLIDGPAQSYSNKLNITESGEVIYEEKKKYNSNIIMSENCIQNNRMNMLMSKRGKINTNLNRSQIETYNNAYKKSALFKWTDEETDKFYQAIEMFGVDLMMVRAFLPKFSDKQIRDKYKKERRNNPLKIEEAIKKNKEIDLDAYENENGRIETSGDLNSDASSISADDDNDVKRKGSVTSETDGNVLTLFEGKEDVDYDMNQHHDNQEDPDFNVLSLF